MMCKHMVKLCEYDVVNESPSGYIPVCSVYKFIFNRGAVKRDCIGENLSLPEANKLALKCIRKDKLNEISHRNSNLNDKER